MNAISPARYLLGCCLLLFPVSYYKCEFLKGLCVRTRGNIQLLTMQSAPSP